MTTTLWHPHDCHALIKRFAQLTPDRTPQWGKMDAGRMVVHVTDTLRLGMGEITCGPPKGPFQFPVIKQLVMFHLPWPKGVPTAPELLSRTPTQFKAEVEKLVATMDRFSTKRIDAEWPLHPAFGRITGSEWGRLMYRHLDHHLTQFKA